jgi:hypothetical protein
VYEGLYILLLEYKLECFKTAGIITGDGLYNIDSCT